MKNFIVTVLFFYILIYTNCISTLGACDSIVDATFTCNAVEYYTHEPVKGLTIYIRDNQYKLVESKVTTDEKGQAPSISKTAIGSCELPLKVNVITDYEDTSLMCTNYNVEFFEPKGAKFVTFQCKTRSLPVLLNVSHKSTETDSLSFSFDYLFLWNLHLFPKNINTKRIFDSTYFFKVFPEIGYEYSYSYLDKSGNRKQNKFSIQTSRKDTVKINIEY